VISGGCDDAGHRLVRPVLWDWSDGYRTARAARAARTAQKRSDGSKVRLVRRGPTRSDGSHCFCAVRTVPKDLRTLDLLAPPDLLDLRLLDLLDLPDRRCGASQPDCGQACVRVADGGSVGMGWLGDLGTPGSPGGAVGVPETR
jgi:hypothetical protein